MLNSNLMLFHMVSQQNSKTQDNETASNHSFGKLYTYTHYTLLMVANNYLFIVQKKAL